MKLILLSLFIFFSLSLSAQWTPTGKTEIWKAIIYLEKKVNGHRQKITGYARFKEMKYVPERGEAGRNIPRENTWVRTGEVYDVNKKKIQVDELNHIEFTQPKTLKVRSE